MSFIFKKNISILLKNERQIVTINSLLAKYFHYQYSSVITTMPYSSCISSSINTIVFPLIVIVHDAYAVWTLPTLRVIMMIAHKKDSLYWLIVKPYIAQGFAKKTCS